MNLKPLTLNKSGSNNLQPFLASMKDDDASFLALVNRAVDRTLQQFHPADVYLVRTDHWFDQKWLGFSGKMLGALGVTKRRLTIPPFVPNRVISQETYSSNKGTSSYRHSDAPPLHLAQPSRQNLTRFVDRVTKSGVFIWFSGGTQQAGMGSIMAYVVAGDSQSAWYASFQRATTWQINKVSGLSKSELVHLTEGLSHGQDA
jgi:hypothetical protein